MKKHNKDVSFFYIELLPFPTTSNSQEGKIIRFDVIKLGGFTYINYLYSNTLPTRTSELLISVIFYIEQNNSNI
jgi:hypothetical protein